MKSLFRISRGFTLIELMVVMTIMSVLAAIVVPQVTGTVTTGKGTAKTGDVNAVTQAVSRYQADSGKYPVAAIASGSLAGVLPTTSEKSKPIDWGASFTSSGVTKYFSITTTANQTGSYIQGNVRHATETRTVASTSAFNGTATSVTTTGTLTDGDLLSANLTGTGTWASADNTTTFVYPVWRIDSNGTVFVDLASTDY